MDINYIKGALLVLGATCCFALQPVFGHWAYEDKTNVVALLWLRFLFAAMLLQVTLWFINRRTNRVLSEFASSARRSPPLLIGMLLSFGALNYFFALTQLSVGITTLLFFLFPAYIFIFSVICRIEPWSWFKLSAVLTALVGVFISINIEGEMPVAGIVTGLISGGCYGGYIMLSQHYLKQSKPIDTLAWVSTGGAFCLSMPLLVGLAHFPATIQGYLAALGLACISTICSLWLLLRGGRLMQRSTDVSVLTTAEIGITLFFAWWLLDEKVSQNEMLGAAIVFLAVLAMLINVGQIRRQVRAD